jgi:macrolide transport system ATP-binding/permease protein
MTQPYVSAVSPMVSTSKTMRYQQNEANATINGVSNDYFDVKGLTFKDGQTFDQRSVRDRSQDVVIDTNTQKQFFSDGTNQSGKSCYWVVYLLVLLVCRTSNQRYGFR